MLLNEPLGETLFNRGPFLYIEMDATIKPPTGDAAKANNFQTLEERLWVATLEEFPAPVAPL
jgi:hypothetical protein